MFYIRPLKILQGTFWCLQTNTCHADMKSSQPGSVMWRARCNRKMWAHSHLFSKNYRTFCQMSDLTTIFERSGFFFLNFTQTSLEKKNRALLCSVNKCMDQNACTVFGDSKTGLFAFGLYKVYSSVLQHIWVTAQTFMSNW